MRPRLRRVAPRLRLRGTLASLCLAVLAAALIAGGCGGGGNTTVTESSSPTSTQQVVVESSSGSFNPAQIYKDVSPGVVTITSVFDTSGNSLLGGGGSQAGQGSGFVVDTDGHIVTNAHVVTSGGHLNGAGSVHEAKQVFVEFGDRNRVPAQ